MQFKTKQQQKRIHFDIVQKSAVNLRVVSSNMTITSQNVNKYKIWKIIQLETEYCTKWKKSSVIMCFTAVDAFFVSRVF